MEHEESIGHNLGIIHNLIGRAISKDIDLKKYPSVTPIQIKILKYIYSQKKNHVYQKDIESLFAIRRSTVSGVLKTMEKNNIIERIDNPNDARSKEIVLTSKAKRKANEMEKKVTELEAILKAGISSEEMVLFKSVLNKIKDNLREYERKNKND
jgi:DNA-binding MarR family transcriptional regulator